MWDEVAEHGLDDVPDASETYDYVESVALGAAGLTEGESGAIGAVLDLLQVEGRLPDSDEIKGVLGDIVELLDAELRDTRNETDPGRRWRLLKCVSKLSGGLVVVGGDILIVTQGRWIACGSRTCASGRCAGRPLSLLSSGPDSLAASSNSATGELHCLTLCGAWRTPRARSLFPARLQPGYPHRVQQGFR